MRTAVTECRRNLKKIRICKLGACAYSQGMKKTLFGLVALTALSSASAASYVGGFIGSDGGVFYQKDVAPDASMRYSLTGLGLFSKSISVAGEADYLKSIGGQEGALNPYFGGGLSVGVSLGSVSGISLYPHALVGAKYNLSGPLSVFGELNAGPAIGFATSSGGSGAGFGFGWGARVGLKYMLNQ